MRRAAGALRQHLAALVVAILGAAFGVVLVDSMGVLTTVFHADAKTGPSHTLSFLLPLVGGVFIAIALYVGAVVTANTCATVVAGRTRELALQRLVGATGAQLRRSFSDEGLVVGVAGALVGGVLGVVVAELGVVVLVSRGTLPHLAYAVVEPTLILPLVAVALTTWGAFRAGSREVLRVTPLQAVSVSVEPDAEQVRARTGRNVVAVVLFVVGILLLAAGLALSSRTPLAVLVAMLGGFVSFSGVVAGATLVMPPLLGLAGRVGAGDPVVRIAGRNAVRSPARSARGTVGLVIGVTLLMTFSVALATLQDELKAQFAADPRYFAGIDTAFTTMSVVLSVVVGFSGVIAAVGVVNAIAVGVTQRRREFGLLRALGFTVAQVRRMVVVEGIQMVATAVVFGGVLGVLYGWAGATALLGATDAAAFRGPSVPPVAVIAVVLGALVVTVIATAQPSRRATRVVPTEALALD